MARTARFEFRVAPDVKERIEAAAALAQEPASDFVRAAAVERAEAVLRRSEVTLVPPDFFDLLTNQLAAPDEPDPRFAQAARRARDVLSDGPER